MKALLRARPLVVAALTAMVCAWSAGAAVAQDAWVSSKERPSGISLGDRVFEPSGELKLFDIVRVHPSFRQALLYDDNIFLEEDDTTGDAVSTTSVGVRFDVTPDDFEFSAGTRYRWEQYLAETEESHGDWFNEFRLGYAGRWLRLTLTDTFSSQEDPLNLVTAERLRRFENHAGARVELLLGRQMVSLSFGDDYLDFDGSFTNLDHRGDTAGVGWQWEFSETRYVFVDYTYGLVDYEKAFRNDYTYHQPTIGIRGPISPRLEGEAAFGWIAQSIQEGRGVTTTEPEYNGPSGRVQLIWNPTPRLSGRISYINALQFADSAAYAVVDRGELAATWTPTATLNWRMYAWVENSDQPGLPPFLQIGGGSTFDWDYTTWLTTGIGLEYRSRTTNLADASYSNFRVWWQVTVYL